jgi:hypothetical protein
MTRKYNRKDSLGAFANAYIEAALWSSTDESDDSGGEPLDKNYSASDIADATIDKMIADCDDFEERFGELIHDDDSPNLAKYGRTEVAGHDFWLSRNGHGANFADGDWPNHGDELQAAAKSYGEFDLYIGDDGQIHGTPLDIHRMGEAREAGGRQLKKKHPDEPGRAGLYQYGPATIWISGPSGGTWWATVKFRNQEKDLDARSFEEVIEKAKDWIDAAPELRASEAQGQRVAARHEPVEDPFYIILPLWSDGTIVGGLGGGGGESFGFDDERIAVQEAKKMLRDPTFEGDYVQVITRDGELVWSSRDEDGASEHVAHEARRTSHQKYRPSKDARLLKVDRIVDTHGTYRVEFTDGLSIQVHSGSGRSDLLYAMRPTDMRYEGRSPGPERRREYQYVALKAVLGDREADFHVDRDGDVVATLRDGGVPGMSENTVRDYIAVDRNDRVIAGPFKSRDEADRHVPPGGYVKFTTAHRRGPPGPAPSSYPMFRESGKRRLTRANALPGTQVQVADDSMSRDWTGMIVTADARRTSRLDNHNRNLLASGAVLVERSNGELFVVYPNALEYATQTKEAGGRARRPKARRKK